MKKILILFMIPFSLVGMDNKEEKYRIKTTVNVRDALSKTKFSPKDELPALRCIGFCNYDNDNECIRVLDPENNPFCFDLEGEPLFDEQGNSSVQLSRSLCLPAVYSKDEHHEHPELFLPDVYTNSRRLFNKVNRRYPQFDRIFFSDNRRYAVALSSDNNSFTILLIKKMIYFCSR